MVSPLERLVVDSRELDADLLAGLLEPYVRIDKGTNEIRGTPGWSRLTVPEKALACLLARKAMVALKMVPPDEEALAPLDIEKLVGVQGNVLRKKLSDLYKGRLVDKRNRTYFVPNHSIEAVKALFEQKTR